MAEKPVRAFVIGHPIAHSRSPLIHGHWLRTYAIAGSYEAVDVAPDAIDAFLESLPTSGFVGGNVTIPHKEAAFARCQSRDAAAEAIGAVNTLWVDETGVCGRNTDAYGFLANLDDRRPGWRSARNALVLGAGGAARAIVHALQTAGLEKVTLANRTAERAGALAQAFGPQVTVAPWEDLEAAASDADLVVNTTALGMKSEGRLPLDVAWLPAHAIVTDIVYVPLMTPLLEAAQARGLVVVDGLGMLLHQAVPGFEQWFGHRPQVTEDLRRLVIADMETPS